MTAGARRRARNERNAPLNFDWFGRLLADIPPRDATLDEEVAALLSPRAFDSAAKGRASGVQRTVPEISPQHAASDIVDAAEQACSDAEQALAELHDNTRRSVDLTKAARATAMADVDRVLALMAAAVAAVRAAADEAKRMLERSEEA